MMAHLSHESAVTMKSITDWWTPSELLRKWNTLQQPCVSPGSPGGGCTVSGLSRSPLCTQICTESSPCAKLWERFPSPSSKVYSPIRVLLESPISVKPPKLLQPPLSNLSKDFVLEAHRKHWVWHLMALTPSVLLLVNVFSGPPVEWKL